MKNNKDEKWTPEDFTGSSDSAIDDFLKQYLARAY